MRDRWVVLAGALALALLPLGACSKTQDTAPETKIFGQPPVFESTPILDPGLPESVSCDFTNAFNVGLPKRLGANLQVAGPVFVGGTYTQLAMHAKVSDPNGLSDILLVSASFIPDPTATVKQEATLVLFDDGSTLKFDYTQTGIVEEDCNSSSGTVTCQQAVSIKLTSNDPIKGDGNYTRQFALVNLNTQGPGAAFFRDCVATQNHQAPFASQPGVQLSFRIDAVDNEGNLTTFPTRLLATAVPSTFTCSGDPCLCCFLRLGIQDVTSPDGQCRGLPGLFGPDAPQGFCNAVAPTP